jgi:8-oxo-dGTP pyrophosphatase MutT (NUDIX family)
MREERSFGIIPLQRRRGEWYALLIQHQQGHWSFPKGRLDPGEKPYECASRELREETGLTVVRLLSDLTFTEEYHLTRNGRRTHKRVTYYAAEVEGEPTPQLEEIAACSWHLLSGVSAILTFDESRSLFQQLMADLTLKKTLA